MISDCIYVCILFIHFLSLSLWHGSDDIRIARICNREGTYTEIFTTSGSQFVIVSRIMMDSGLGQHGVVLDLGFPEKCVNDQYFSSIA